MTNMVTAIEKAEKAHPTISETIGIAIVWITEESEYDDFMSKYGDYVKDKTVIRR